MWAVVLYLFVAERLWKLDRLKHWSIRGKVLICVAWFAVISGVIFLPLRKLYYYSDEDFRVSFEYEVPAPDNITIRYVFLNLGKQSALVNGVALFDLTGTSQLEDYIKYVDWCDEVPVTTLIFQQFMGNFIRFSTRAGAIGIVRHAKNIMIEGYSEAPKGPIAVESGKTRIITASFDIPKSEKDTDARVLCPIISTRDLKNLESTAICKGASFSWSLTPNSTTAKFANYSGAQLRLLPRSNDLPTCPAS